MYEMREASAVAEAAARDIEAWLRARPKTARVENVEADPKWREADVDLLWTTTDGVTRKIEIKGDRWHQSGNFFFETHSNKERGTPGCFLYTQADWLLYYFVVPRVLYCLPMPATRAWFVADCARFRERATHTPIGNGGCYTTVGRLVPISDVLAEVPNVRRETL